MRSEKLWHVNHDPFTLCLPHSVGWTQYFPPVQANYIAICIPRFQLESSKESTFHAGETGDVGSIPGLGRCPGEGNGYPLQYSFLANSVDRGAWWAIVHRVVKSLTGLSD